MSWNCCPSAEFQFLAQGVQVRELQLQSDSTVLQFFPYRAIQSVRYSYMREEREGMLSLWIQAQGTPGAGGLSFRWRFPCSTSGEAVYQDLLQRLNA